MEVSIGEFARMTHLTSKALRHYHREGVLVPARVDEATGYRWYAVEQTATAQLVRRYRALDLSIDQVRTLLAATGAERAGLLEDHLARMESELERARSTVASLRRLLEQPSEELAVDHRHVAETAVIAVTATVDVEGLGEWWVRSFAELDRTLATQGIEAAGPRGGVYSTELFADGRGEATVFLPVPAASATTTLPAVDLAVARHDGEDVDADRVYGALGRYVTERGLSVPGPVRETYLDGVTEIGWPVRGQDPSGAQHRP